MFPDVSHARGFSEIGSVCMSTAEIDRELSLRLPIDMSDDFSEVSSIISIVQVLGCPISVDVEYFRHLLPPNERFDWTHYTRNLDLGQGAFDTPRSPWYAFIQ